jgi:hypothetical protein
MSTTIITNQAAIKFSIKDIIDDIKNDANSEQINSLLEVVYGGTHLFNTWQAEYAFLTEEYVVSNVVPQTSRWNSFLPPLPESDLICGYIKNALTSFEGGICRFKGSSHTRPETALRKLRATLDDAPSFYDFSRFNPRGLDFSFDMYEDTNNEVKGIIGKLGFDLNQPLYNQKSSKHDTGFIRFDIRVRKASDIIKVIMINSISTQTSKVSAPRFTGTITNKITNSLLNKTQRLAKAT